MVYSPAFISNGYPLGVLLRAGLRLSGLRQFQAFWPAALVRQALVAIVSQHCAASVARLLFTVGARRQVWVSLAGVCV